MENSQKNGGRGSEVEGELSLCRMEDGVTETGRGGEGGSRMEKDALKTAVLRRTAEECKWRRRGG